MRPKYRPQAIRKPKGVPALHYSTGADTHNASLVAFAQALKLINRITSIARGLLAGLAIKTRQTLVIAQMSVSCVPPLILYQPSCIAAFRQVSRDVNGESELTLRHGDSPPSPPPLSLGLVGSWTTPSFSTLHYRMSRGWHSTLRYPVHFLSIDEAVGTSALGIKASYHCDKCSMYLSHFGQAEDSAFSVYDH